MNQTEPLRPGTPEVSPKRPEEKTPEDLKMAKEAEMPVIEVEQEAKEDEKQEEMVIEEPTQTPVELSAEPTSSSHSSDVIEEGDVRDEPLNTVSQASRLQETINTLQ